MWEYEFAVETTASVEAVWKVWSDVEAWPEWNAGVEKIRIDGPFAAGTRFVMTPPGEDGIELRLADVRVNEGFTDIMDGGDVVVTTVHRLERLAGGGARVVYRTEIEGPGAEDIGPAITGDFPEVLAALVRRAEG